MTLILLLMMGALPPGELIVSPADLAGMENALPLDVRNEAAFAAGHLPGAVNVWHKSLSEERNGVKNRVKPVEEIRKTLLDAGVDPGRHIVVYTEWEKTSDLKDAARVFWILEYAGWPMVSFLDGGMNRWVAGGFPVETGSLKAGKTDTLPPAPQPDRMAIREDVLDLTDGKTGVLVDVRPGDYYSGKSIKEEFVSRAGHIPGAVSLPVMQFFDTEGLLRLPDETCPKLQQVAGDKSDPVIVYCNTGQSGSLSYLVWRISGYSDVKLYDGSMAEWAAHPALVVETEQ